MWCVVGRFAKFDVNVTVPGSVRVANLDTATQTREMLVAQGMVASLYLSLTEVLLPSCAPFAALDNVFDAGRGRVHVHVHVQLPSYHSMFHCACQMSYMACACGSCA